MGSIMSIGVAHRKQHSAGVFANDQRNEGMGLSRRAVRRLYRDSSRHMDRARHDPRHAAMALALERVASRTRRWGARSSADWFCHSRRYSSFPSCTACSEPSRQSIHGKQIEDEEKQTTVNLLELA